MLHFSFRNNFSFVLAIFALVNYAVPQETDQPPHFPKEKCESLLDKCSCDFTDSATPAVKIVCKNLKDFPNFTRILDEVIDFEVEYSMEFVDIKSFPARILQGLKINELTINATGAVVDRNVLEGVTYLKIFTVEQSGIKIVPDFSYVQNSVQNIKIHQSSLESLEGESFQNLTLTKYLSFVHDDIRYIDPDVFKGTDNVETLDLSNNLLTSIPPNLLDPMRNLTKFSANYNRLLHVNDLFAITHPKFIYLHYNNITDVDSVLHLNMPEVRTLVLSYNPIKNVSVASFKDKIPNVTNLRLINCSFQEFHVEAFSTLTKLRYLDLTDNLIEEIIETENGLTVEYLILDYNKLQHLINFPQYSTFYKVNFYANQIQYLTEEDFKSVKNISYLVFEKNKIERIDTKTFLPLRNHLIYLNLDSNNIKTLNGSLRYLSRLVGVMLSSNSIETFAKDEFKGLNELFELYLQNNKITSLAQLQPIPHLIYAFIEDNSIETITPDDVPEFLTSLEMQGNPLKCDCRMHPFMLYLNTSKIFTAGGMCLKENFMNSLDKMPGCPETCSCGCINEKDISFMFADCGSRNLSFTPQFLNNSALHFGDNGTDTFNHQVTIEFGYLHTMANHQYEYPSSYLKDYVLGINLENNSLEFIDASQLHHNLIQLYLANNKLTRLPEVIFDNFLHLKSISLSGNPWICDCNTLKFKAWMTLNYPNIQDINDTRCGNNKGNSHLDGRVIWTLTDLDLCPRSLGWITWSIISFLIFLSSCLAAKILYKNYELNIKVFFWSHGFTFVKEEEIDCDKPFDAFLSFSHMDGEFVTKEIIWEIEKTNPNVRLCIHYRDFKAGEFIHDNIIRAIQNSKRTVFILSKNFLESEWCLLEFRTAHIQALEDRVHRIVLIKVGELPEDIDQSIKLYLDSTTYLTWGEKYFWKKILYILPSSSSVRNPAPENREEIEII